MEVVEYFVFVNTVAFWLFETASAWWRIGRWQRWFCKIFWSAKLHDVVEKLLRTQLSNEPKQLPLPLKFWSIFPLAWTYAAARLYLIVESFVGLRAVEPTVYYDMDWSAYFPHLS